MNYISLPTEFTSPESCLDIAVLFERCVVVIWLSSYSTDMNLIERVRKPLKQRVTANNFFADVQHMIQAIQTELVHQNCSDYLFRLSFSKN